MTWYSVPVSSSGLPVLAESEFTYLAKRFESLEHPPLLSLQIGTLSITSTRLIYVCGESHNGIDLRLIDPVIQSNRTVLNLASTRKVTLGLIALPTTIQVKFESGSDADEFISSVKTSIERKAWLNVADLMRPRGPVVGVSGLLKQHDREKRDVGKVVSESFSDLEALMTHAKTVVDIMERYKARTGSEQQDDDQFSTLLMSIGIKSPVTKDGSSVGSYHASLARELADFLLSRGILDKAGGMLTLPDIYCIFNRARGLALVSPEDLAEAAKLLQPLKLNIALRTYSSGISVVQLDTFDDSAMCETLRALASENSRITADFAAAKLAIPLSIARECIELAESRGYLCRDSCLEVTCFYKNAFGDFLTRFDALKRGA